MAGFASSIAAALFPKTTRHHRFSGSVNGLERSVKRHATNLSRECYQRKADSVPNSPSRRQVVEKSPKLHTITQKIMVLTTAHKSIAPKLCSDNLNEVTSSNTNVSNSAKGCRRKIAFHPTLGYAITPPVPQKVQRRNQRERNRVKQVNCGFEMLRAHIPSAAKQKKMSKVDTLR